MKSWIKKNWGMACLIGAVLLLCISGSLAAYTNYSSAKKVVSAQTKGKTLFSSNLLYTEELSTESSSYRNRKYILTGTDSLSFSLEIYNYNLADPSTYNNKNITYTLQCTLLSSSDTYNLYSIASKESTVGFTEQSDGSYTATIAGQTLAGNERSQNSYTFTVPDADKEKLKLCIEAIPDSNSYSATNNQKLAAVIFTGEMIAEKNWTGRLMDSQEGHLPIDYDGFNFEISGNGQGKVTLSWNPSVLKISPWFADDTKATEGFDESTGWPTLQFSVGGAGQPSAYQTQFYWVDKQDLSWDALREIIRVNFTEPENNN